MGVSNLKLIDCYELNVSAAIVSFSLFLNHIAMNFWEIKIFK
jgi:hypothetical protein